MEGEGTTTEAPEAGAGQPEGGTPPPQVDEGAEWRKALPPEAQKAITDRESENKALRDQLKDAEIRDVKRDHPLDDATWELLNGLPRDQVRPRAEAISQARGAAAPPAPEPPKEPENKGDLETMAEGAEGGTPPKPTQPGDATLEAIKKIDPKNATAELKKLQEQDRRSGSQL
jgi:hypothetical protein